MKWFLASFALFFFCAEAQDATVFFPYLNGKSTDDLFPYLTTSETSRKILLFASSQPLNAVSLIEADNPTRRLRLLKGDPLKFHGCHLKIVPGLSGHVRSVSFQSRKHPGMYIQTCDEDFLCMKLYRPTRWFNKTASFIERYAMDGSGGRSYECIGMKQKFVGLNDEGLLRIIDTVYTSRFPKAVSWDLRILEDNETIQDRPRKQSEIEHFSRGTVMYSRSNDSKNFALGIIENSKFMAALTKRDVGNRATLFNMVPGLFGDKRTVSFESTLMKNYYLMINNEKVFILRRYYDARWFRLKTSFLPVAAFDGSQAYSFESKRFRNSFICASSKFNREGITFGSVTVRSKRDLIGFAQQCSWDLRVMQKNATLSNTTYEDMQYSMRGPEVLGKEMGIPSGDEFVYRTQQVLTSRTREWIQGLPSNASCSPTGDRCSMGLVCRNTICQVLNSTASDLPGSTAPALPIEDTPSLPRNIGCVCNPSLDIPCSNGVPCVQQGQKYFCVPERDSPSARWITEPAQQVPILESSNSASSYLSPWEYSSRAQNIVYSMSEDWSKGLSHRELCEHSEARCSLELVCIVALDNRRRCLEK